jgi:hypothetical protein
VVTTTEGTAGRQRDGVVTSTKVVKGSRAGRGPAQSSLSNYRLQATAGGGCALVSSGACARRA